MKIRGQCTSSQQHICKVQFQDCHLKGNWRDRNQNNLSPKQYSNQEPLELCYYCASLPNRADSTNSVKVDPLSSYCQIIAHH
jgi:hypothetical protein